MSQKLSTLTTKIEKIAIQTTVKAFTSKKAETERVPEIITAADAIEAMSQQPIATQAPKSSSVFQEPVTNFSSISTKNPAVANNTESSYFSTNTTGNYIISTTSNFTTAISTSITNTSTSTTNAIPTTTTTTATPPTTSDPAVFCPYLYFKYFLQLLIFSQEIFRCNSLTLPKNVRNTILLVT